MIVVKTDGFEFRFEDAIDAFVFDETDKTKSTFHGVPMKCVDIVAEFDEAYVYVELKDYDDPAIFDIPEASTENETHTRQDNFRWLKNYLKYKFRDSYLYRHAENKVDKPIRYICLTNFDNALNSRMQKSLKEELPVGKASRRWVQALATGCHVMNLDKWNDNFPKWPVSRLSASEVAGEI
jgi:hypothetical protein